MSPKISDGDYNTKLNLAKKFISKKYQVKFTVFFRGRELSRRESGFDMINRFLEDISDVGEKASDVSNGPRMINVMINPK